MLLVQRSLEEFLPAEDPSKRCRLCNLLVSLGYLSTSPLADTVPETVTFRRMLRYLRVVSDHPFKLFQGLAKNIK